MDVEGERGRVREREMEGKRRGRQRETEGERGKERVRKGGREKRWEGES